MERVAAHLGECPVCEARRAELAGRAARVSALMGAFPEPERVASLPLITRRPRTGRRWAAAAALLAAAVVIAFVLAPKRVAPVAEHPMQVLPPVSSGGAVPSLPASGMGHPALLGQIAQSRTENKKVKSNFLGKLPKPADYYLALDNEPIETGVVVRVALGPTEIPADVIFDQAGRARAIRLIQ
jgi:hypothetical protein